MSFIKKRREEDGGSLVEAAVAVDRDRSGLNKSF
jgi:hypothetical protein